MMRLPVAAGVDSNPSLGLHRGSTTEHAEYNKMIIKELDALEFQASKHNWDSSRVQKEIQALQREKQAGFKNGQIA